jgi:hypothetical protein
MLDYFSVLDPNEIVERGWPGRQVSLGHHKHKVAFSHVTTGCEVQLASFLGHACDSTSQLRNSIADLRSVLHKSGTHKLFDQIGAQSHHNCFPIRTY